MVKLNCCDGETVNLIVVMVKLLTLQLDQVTVKHLLLTIKIKKAVYQRSAFISLARQSKFNNTASDFSAILTVISVEYCTPLP